MYQIGWYLLTYLINCFLTYLLTDLLTHYSLTYLLTNLLTYSLTHSMVTVLLQKLTGLQLVKKFPAFYVTRRFITALTSVRHLSLSWARSIQSIPPHPTTWRSILILSSHLCLRLPSGLFTSGSPPKSCIQLYSSQHVLHALPTLFFSILSREK